VLTDISSNYPVEIYNGKLFLADISNYAVETCSGKGLCNDISRSYAIETYNGELLLMSEW
jgi:hypothetical protein